MNRRKFIKTSMCLGCGAALLPVSQSLLLPQILSKFSNDKFIYKRKEDMPKRVCLEACSLCQLNCPACGKRFLEKYISKTEGFGYLKYRDFKAFIDDNPQIESIELAYSGEIFLNPELDKIIEYANKKNIKLTAGSGVNLNELSDRMAELLVKYKFRHLTVSIDGATPEVYKIYRRGGDLNKVFANIEKINKYKKQYNSEYPYLVYKFIVFGHNEHEIDLAKQKAKELNMNIQFDQNAVPEYSPIRNKEEVFIKTGIRELSKFDIMDYNNWSMCAKLFEEPQINWNGNLQGCCEVICGNFGANVFEVGLMNALNSKAYIEAKHMVTDLSFKPTIKLPCLYCWFYKDMKKTNKCISKYS